MDENSAQPQVIYTAPTPWYKNKKLIILLFIVFLTISLITFLYFKPQKTPNPFVAPFPCPLSDQPSCKTQTPINLKKGSAVGYKAPAKSSVVNSVEIPSTDYIGVSENKKKNEKYLFESTPSKTGCQTIIYIFPSEATFGNIFSFPLVKGQVLAVLSSNGIKAGDDYFNVIIQVRNDPASTDEGKCSLTNKSPEFFNIE